MDRAGMSSGESDRAKRLAEAFDTLEGLASPPFSFAYGGQSSKAVMAAWEREEMMGPVTDGTEEKTVTQREPETGLEVRAEITFYRDFPAVEWVLYFKNTADADTPIIENTQALDLVLPGKAKEAIVLRYPTLIKMAGLQTEDDRQGQSWLPLTRGDYSGCPEYAFSEYHGDSIRQSWYMLPRGPYKYTYYSHHMQPSLFNIEEDPMENVDLAPGGSHGKVLKDFEARLRSIVDPETTALESKRDFGLIGPDGEDYSVTRMVQASRKRK